MEKSDLNLTLTDLDKTIHLQSFNNKSFLVRRINELSKKKLKDYSIEDIRISIGQAIILPYLVPLALEKLRENILAEGDFYEGDLLFALLNVENTFWTKHKFETEEFKKICEANKELIDVFDTSDEIREDLKKAIKNFIINRIS